MTHLFKTVAVSKFDTGKITSLASMVHVVNIKLGFMD